MGDAILPSTRSPFGRRVHQRLTEEQVIWFTSIAADGTPQPNPVWFIWQDPASVLTYNRADAFRLGHIRQRPRVALHFDGNGRGGNIVVLTGSAEIAPDEPAPHEHEQYLNKYRKAMIRVSGSLEGFSAAYPVGVRVQVERIRGF
jgi:PPOX class probable F420-dependent enzyme